MRHTKTPSAITDIQLLQHSKRHENQAESPLGTVLVLLIFALLSLPALAQGPSYPYNVALSFTASTGTVTGYNIYRISVAPSVTACPPSGYAKLNSSPFTATAYTDPNPAQGFYCYSATAVDGTQESGFSNFDGPVSIPPAPPTNLGYTLSQNGTPNVEFAWTQSGGAGLTANTLYCDATSTSPMTKRWSGKPAIAHAISLSLAGTHKCAVTASANGESGFSNIVLVSIP